MPEARNETLIASLRRRVLDHPTFADVVRRIDQRRIELTGLSIEARALLLAAMHEALGKRLAVVVANDAAVGDLELALRLFHSRPDCVAFFPSPSLSPYQEISPSLGVVREEIRALGQLARGSVEILIAPARALFARLPPPGEFLGRMLEIGRGKDIDVRQTLQHLVENGFTRMDLVGEVGEFAFRGGILDVFAPNASNPVRIELFGDSVESLREFDPQTQRSDEHMERLVIQPMSQFPSTPERRSAMARRLSLDFMDPLYKRDVAAKIERLSEHGSFPGVEHYMPLGGAGVSFSDYLPADQWLVVTMESDQIVTTITKYESLLRTEFEAAAEKGRAVYAPEVFLSPGPDILSFLSSSPLAMSELHVASREFDEIRLHGSQISRYANRLSDFTTEVSERRGTGRHQLLFTSTKGGREKVERLLTEFHVPFADDPPAMRDEIVVTRGHLASGFAFDELDLTVYSEWDLFEPPTSGRMGARKRASDTFVTDLRDLKIGDFIVHVDHGVGRFRGLQRIAFGVNEREVMELEYANAGKLLLPMESLNLIQKYSGGGDSSPKLDKLGGTSWARTKASVKKAMRDMADELLKLYATRQMVQGHPFSKDSPWQFDFEDAFEFEETDDQLNAIDDLKADMESRKPMDRLLCGDVGYGKTEVAMRGAFKAVMDGKQAAMLAPTTILAYQHYRTFLRRFSSFPVTVELLTRYYSAKDQRAIVSKIESGEIDIIIGTHRVLSKDIKFKDLGLVVIDEEQRFGVAQKEKLKQLKKAVDVLAMSATPIPRTLHMSLVGIRDISVIETPPKDRLAIQTAVVPFGDDFIREAIDFETNRGGQVFFVHNRVESIYAMKEYLEKLIPGLRVTVGHGQMDERELERIMAAFINREHDVLLATTIIENGIDIPACNTILINHAERFGLSQLYQLRGRVGRSDRLAFCYLLVPSDKILTSDARKRLSAIQEFSDLGAGFRIAARDLEIRGSGNLLGGEQSGEIAAVGFEMYCKLLEETVREMKGERVEEEIETSMSLGVDIYIPPEYVADENLRMTFYKKIASAGSDQRLEDIRNELRDRFGALPAKVESLLHFVKVKRLAQSLGVVSVIREGSLAIVKLAPAARVDPNRLVEVMQSDNRIKFSPAGVLSLPLGHQGTAVIGEIEALLHSIAVQ